MFSLITNATNNLPKSFKSPDVSRKNWKKYVPEKRKCGEKLGERSEIQSKINLEKGKKEKDKHFFG